MSAESAMHRHHWLLVLLLWCLVGSGRAEELVEVQLLGLSGEPLDNARAALSLERAARQPELTAGSIRRLHDKADGEIRRALEPFGYYRPEIQAELSPPSVPGEPWQASYVVDPAEPLPIAEVAIGFHGAGATAPELAELAATSPFKQEATLDHRRYEAAKRDLLQQVHALGYLDAEYSEHRIEVDLDVYSARISLQVETGPRYVFGELGVDQDLFDPDFLDRFVVLQPGTPYSSAELGRQRRILGRSGYFRGVEIEPQPATGADPPAIPLQLQLEPFLPNRFRAGLGWGSDTGIGTQLDWTRRYIGRQGHHFNLNGAVVQERRRLAGDFSYYIPLDPLAGSQLELALRHESKDLTYEDVGLPEGGETRIATNLLSATWHLPGQSLGEFELTRELGLSLVAESYDVFEVLFGNLPQGDQEIIKDFIGDDAFATLSPSFRAVVPALRWVLRRSDDRLFIDDGDYLSLELRGAHESLGSNVTFWQARARSWHIRPLLEHGRLLLRSDFGYSDAESRQVLGANFNQMPEYYEFRAGGARSVRGYAYESLYPIDAITGGKHLLVGSVEYEHEIIPDWSAALFVDAGDAFNRFEDMDIRLGTGIGVRWRSPVGMARLDLAVPLDEADDPFQIYITVGPEF